MGDKPRKKAVRKAPLQKDYPSKLAWLEAMMAYQEGIEVQATEAKLARIDKRLAALKIEYLKIESRIDKLARDRDELAGITTEPTGITITATPADEV